MSNITLSKEITSPMMQKRMLKRKAKKLSFQLKQWLKAYWIHTTIR